MLSDHALRDRGLLLGLVVVSLLAVTVLASGLSSVEIQNSRQFSTESGQGVANLANLSISASATSALIFLAGFLRLLLLVLLPFSIYYFIKSANARKRILIQVLYLGGFTYMILALSQSFGQSPLEATPEPHPGSTGPTASPDVIVGVPNVPGWVYVLASVAITLLLSAIAVLAYRRFLRPARSGHNMTSEARWALDALDRGVSLENVIFRAYYQLCTISSDRLGVKRHPDMTPTEYEKVLARSGMPSSPLASLTRLFEKARYGSAALGDDDEQEAVAALRLILGEGG
jgi:Domain of unknown function (DUF4129)